MRKWAVVAGVCVVAAVVAAPGPAAVAQSQAQGQRFSDVAAGHYAFEAVEWAASAGVTVGYGDGTFRPSVPLRRWHALVFMERFYDEILQAEESDEFTRGDMMVLLKAINDGTLAGADASAGLAPEAAAGAEGQRFGDVAADHYAFEAVQWAASAGVTVGYGDGTFRPSVPLGRWHALVFMERFYDEILQADESADFTRGDMMVLLKAINDGTLRDTRLGDDTQIAEVYGRLLPELMGRWNIPGGALALVRDGRLLFAAGYGYANTDTQQPVRPDSLFRIASVSKPITAVAVLKLVEQGRLNLNDHAFDLLNLEATVADPRVRGITIRHLLHHTAGWDRASSFDPMFTPDRVARHLGTTKPVSCAQTVRFMLARRLDFDPGERYAYSNLGYCVLGLIIEAVTEQSYEEYVTEHILGPLGITRMRIGATLASDAAEGEVTYYAYPGQPWAYSAVSALSEMVPWPYGGFHLEAMKAHGGWVGSAIDLARFAVSVDGTRPPAALRPATVETMLSPPGLRPGPPAYYYAMGWSVRPVGEENNWWHDGSMPGTSSLLVRTHHGMVWAVVFNSRPKDQGTFMGELDVLMWQGLREIDQWPSHDLFEHYGYD